MNQILLVNNLIKEFSGNKGQKTRAVDNVSFSLNRGEAIGLVGESGSGKTTLIRMLAHLLTPTSGQIRFMGHDIDIIPQKTFSRHGMRKRLQMVFQDPSESLNPSMRIRQIIGEPILCLDSRFPQDQLKILIEEVCDLVHFPPSLLGQFPHQLSGGQKARAGIARAIITKPFLLLLDEPTTALDASTQAKILLLLADFREKLGMSYVFVSHDLNVVRLLCDRLYIMKSGIFVEEGRSDDIFKNPQDPYTKTLLEAIPS